VVAGVVRWVSVVTIRTTSLWAVATLMAAAALIDVAPLGVVAVMTAAAVTDVASLRVVTATMFGCIAIKLWLIVVVCV